MHVLSEIFGPWIIGAMVPIVIFMIPIVAILTAHQQKMAKIIHEGGGKQAEAQIEALRGEVAQLKALIHQQAIQMDNLLSLSKQTSSTQQIGARIEQ